jgi:ribonuclease T2
MNAASRVAVALALGGALGWASAASAEVPLSGSFIAGKSCPAYQSFRKATNPGNVNIEAGHSYRLLAKNAATASHYRIEIEGASPPERWVAADCGTAEGNKSEAPAPETPSGEGTAVRPAVLILSLSWEPSFCATMAAKTECKKEGAASFEATHLSLHGLWPQPSRRQYCNVDSDSLEADRKHDWEALPEVSLDPVVRQRLDEVMPGTQSLLERHEWLRHGTCYYDADATAYFREAVDLVEEVNNSGVRALFAAHVGKQLTADAIRAAFDAAFGKGAGDRVKLSCKGKGPDRLLTEITIGLGDRPVDGAKLGDLILSAAPTDPGCPEGVLAAAR